MEKIITKENAIYWILGILFLLLLFILFLSDGFYGGGDNLTHYRYSRYSWIYPKWFLWHWGKPVFTLLTSPFAQFGFAGVQVFNIIVSISTAYLGYRIVKLLKIRNSLIYPFFLIFAPIYTVYSFSGMTEPLFGFFGILFTFLFLNGKTKSAATAYSFAPLVRTEGIIFLPVYALITLINKKYRALPYFLVGAVVYSIIGYFYYHDILWLINELPYGTSKPYGTGTLGHYFKRFIVFQGTMLTILFLAGSIRMFIQLKRDNNARLLFLFVFIPYVTYFFAHVTMWWSGIGNSIGADRYMVVIMPLGAVMALYGINYILDGFSNGPHQQIIKSIVISAMLIYVVAEPFIRHNIPKHLNQKQRVTKECCEWIKSNGYLENKFYYLDTFVFFSLDIDPFDETVSRPGLYNKNIPQKHVKPGSVVIYDTDRWPQRTPLKEMINSPYYRLIKTFGGKNKKYEHYIYVFERVVPSS